ncbi:MAG: hypothetical protein RLZZ58_327 [Pseudomonadota bacterium]|jgi:hypothetical protein
MTRRMDAILVGVTAAALMVAACGKREELKPLAGDKPPVAPAGATRPATSEELTTADSQARPARSDELLRRSEERPTDAFDLPPPG